MRHRSTSKGELFLTVAALVIGANLLQYFSVDILDRIRNRGFSIPPSDAQPVQTTITEVVPYNIYLPPQAETQSLITPYVPLRSPSSLSSNYPYGSPLQSRKGPISAREFADKLAESIHSLPDEHLDALSTRLRALQDERILRPAYTSNH